VKLTKLLSSAKLKNKWHCTSLDNDLYACLVLLRLCPYEENNQYLREIRLDLITPNQMSRIATFILCCPLTQSN